MAWPQTDEVKSTCKCGATFNASGGSMSVGWRFREFLEAHEACLEQEKEE
jgi:hypothetical protein